MKNGIKNFREKHPGSIIILKMINDPLRVWKENHSVTMFRCYFRINKGHDHILLVDDKKLPRLHEKIFYNIFYWYDTDLPIKDILCSPKGSKHCGAPLGYSMFS